MNGRENTVTWAPQPGPQHALIDCELPEILYGGARGGGKTDGILGKYGIKSFRYGRRFNAIFFRKEMPQQDDLIERAKEIYLPTGADWNEYHKRFVMPGGGRIRFRPLENVIDAQKYQGQNLSDAAVEEAGNYASSGAIDMLFGCLRSTTGVPVQLMLSANPGGPGQHWIKSRFIDPEPLGMKVLHRTLPDGSDHAYTFIPSLVQNNKILMEKDPGYISRLYLVGSPELVRAWLQGDWTVVAGAFFPEFSLEKHVIKPFEVPEHWSRIRAMDWGSARPFSVGWYAVSDGSIDGIARGCMVKYREWYGMKPEQHNVGLKLTAEEVAHGIRTLEATDPKIADAVLDPSAFSTDGGPSLAERIGAQGVYFREADNKRVARSGALGGWDQLRARLKGNGDGPLIVFFSTCVHSIRTIPTLQHDQLKPEDVDTEAEDHAADETRYACMSRPITHDAPGVPKPVFQIHRTFAEMVKHRTNQRLSMED